FWSFVIRHASSKFPKTNTKNATEQHQHIKPALRTKYRMSLCRLDCPEFQPNAQLMVCLMECKDRKTYVSDCPNQSISTIHTSLPAFADGKFGSATVTRKLALHPPGMSNKPVALSTSDYALCIQLSIVAIRDVETRRTRLRF
ncbi:hypothetical protein CSKR_112485, partial [Clonorchis sinensis]